MNEFRKTWIDGLTCSVDGRFKKNRMPIKVSFPVDALGRKRRALITIKHDGMMKKFPAARIIAQTWNPSIWYNDCYIKYKDGNTHNIHSDNLILVSEKDYFRERGIKNLACKKLTFEQSRMMVETMAIEANLAKGYFETGRFDEINKYMESVLIPRMIEYSIGKLSFSMTKVNEFLPELIGILYEHIMAYRPVGNYTRFCKSLIRTYRRKGTFGWYDNYRPNVIEREITNLNIDSLCKRFREMKIK